MPKKTPKKEPRRAIAVGQTALTLLPPDRAGEVIPKAKGIGMTVNGLVVSGRPTIGAMALVVKDLCVGEKASPFAIGDAQLQSERLYGDRSSQLFDVETGLSEKTLGVYYWLADRIAYDRRRMDRLNVRHHMLVARLSAAKQAHWLTKAAADGDEKPWTIGQLETALAEQEDELPPEFFVLVKCPNGAQQNSLIEQLEAQGLPCEARTKYGKKKAVASADGQAELALV